MKSPTPVLTVAGAEQITQNPLTVKSTFSIPAKTLLLQRSEADSQEILTDVCGLGWFFGVQALPPSLPNGIHKSIFTAAQTRGRLTIVESSRQDAIPVRLELECHELDSPGYFNSKTIAFADRLGISHVSCTLRAPGPDGITRSCDTVSVTATETVTIGTFHYEHPFDYKEDGDGGEEDTFVFSFVVEMGSARRDSKVVPERVEPRAAMGLAESLRTGCIVDTKFYLYSRKTSEGGASHLKQIYASSAILRGISEDLDVLLQSRGFKGSETVCLDLFELEDEDQETEHYDYPGEDSDLEPEELPESLSSPNFSTEATIGPDGISPCGPATYEDGDGDKAKPTNKDLAIRSHVRMLNIHSYRWTDVEKNFMRMGRVIVLKDTAFATWEALIRYIYFNETHFSNLRSTGSPAPAGFPGVQCSPKSMYRLADKFGIDTLKALALENIKKQMTVQNVVTEVFSKFSSLYPEVLHAEVEYLLDHYADSKIQAGISNVLQTPITGEYAHRLDAMQRIITGVTKQINPYPTKAVLQVLLL
ncbi:hypothetical protein BDZ89DRAFT_1144108 [Hymenopellis radicata]|nr:hypothetical protein BDZ89DRAFT_1144108 [Hymenopellis radicata]